MLLPDDERVYAFTRRLGDVELLVLGNFSGEDAAVELPEAAAGRPPRCCSATSTGPGRTAWRCAPGRRACTAARSRRDGR